MFPSITRLTAAPDPLRAGDGHGTLSLGLSLAGGHVHWGDLLLPPAGDDAQTALGDTLRLRDLITPALAGQRPEGFRDFAKQLRAAIATNATGLIAGEVAAAGQLALQGAFLSAAAAARGQTIPELLRAEYDLPPADDPSEVAFFLAIEDRQATAAHFDRMIALRPAGIGYRLTGERVAESIGDNAEFLQRFVRELGQRTEQLTRGENYRPAIYLGLNGALGHLAGDPVRHIGKVLGNVVGLQAAAGPRRLILEEPFLLDEVVDQAANLNRLQDFLRRAPESTRPAEPTTLVSSAVGLLEDEVQVYTDTRAAHALALDPLAGGLDLALANVGRARAAGLALYLLAHADLTPRWAALLAGLAEAVRPAAVIADFGGPAETIPLLIARLVTEAAVARLADD